jgi:hypothetical protein
MCVIAICRPDGGSYIYIVHQTRKSLILKKKILDGNLSAIVHKWLILNELFPDGQSSPMRQTIRLGTF